MEHTSKNEKNASAPERQVNELKPQHPNADHPATGRLGCVQQYQIAGGLPIITTGGTNTFTLGFKGGLCTKCGFDEAWHKLTHEDYVGKLPKEECRKFNGR